MIETRNLRLELSDRGAVSNGGPGFKIDDGRPIPEAWDERAIGVRY